jgi:deoxyadenosine/deoxycytidine kinase
MGNKVQYGVVLGKTCTGKTTVANYMEQELNLGTKVINMEKIKADNPPMDMTQDPPAPIEGEECKIETVEQLILDMVKANPSTRWVFDNYLHTTEEAFLNFIAKLGTPDYILFLECHKEKIESNFLAKN